MSGLKVSVARPSRRYDGEGTVESFETVSALWVADAVVLDSGQKQFEFNADDDIQIDDVIKVPHAGAYIRRTREIKSHAMLPAMTCTTGVSVNGVAQN